MKSRKVGGEGQEVPTRRLSMAQALRRIIDSYVLDDLPRGGRVVASSLANLKAQLEQLPPALRNQFQLQTQQQVLGSVEGRGAFIKALVKALGFKTDPPRVVEFYSGANLSGPLALPDTQEYIQVSNDPLISALADLPKEFLASLGIGEINIALFAKLASAMRADQRVRFEQIITAAVPNLTYKKETVEAFARRPAMANRADLCLAFFWASDPFWEMEAVVKPGGFMVTIDIPREDLDKVAAAAPGPVLQDAKEVEHSQARPDLMAKFTRLLRETPGYRELKLRVVVFQKQ